MSIDAEGSKDWLQAFFRDGDLPKDEDGSTDWLHTFLHDFALWYTDRCDANVLDEIQKRIKDGTLAKGDKLPSERNLANQLQVSRVAVREAISYLEAFGVIVKKSDGNYISSSFNCIFSRPFEMISYLEKVPFFDLINLRKELELYQARLLFERITTEQTTELDKLIDQAINASGKNSRPLMAVISECFRQYTNNQLLTVLTDSVSSLVKNMLVDVFPEFSDVNYPDKKLLEQSHKEASRCWMALANILKGLRKHDLTETISAINFSCKSETALYKLGLQNVDANRNDTRIKELVQELEEEIRLKRIKNPDMPKSKEEQMLDLYYKMQVDYKTKLDRYKDQ